MKTGENKRSAFKRLASNRANNAINYIRLLGNLSNSNNYNYNEDEIKKIFTTLDEELKFTKTKFMMTLNRKRKIRL